MTDLQSIVKNSMELYKSMQSYIEKLNEELSQMMLYTGIPDTKSFDSSVLHFE